MTRAHYLSGGFAFVTHDDESVYDLYQIECLDPATNAAGCYLMAAGVDSWHARLAALGAQLTSIEDMPWGHAQVPPHRNKRQRTPLRLEHQLAPDRALLASPAPLQPGPGLRSGRAAP